jgi:excisionase family DNA binding protein
MREDQRLPRLVYTLKEVEGILNVSRTTIWKLRKSRQLKCKKIGSRVLITANELQAFISQESEPYARHRQRRP